MIANAVRFASEPTKQTLRQADAWADAAIEAVRPRIHQGFGVIQLMTLLLAQHYDLNRGNFTSAWLLGAECTRMMQMMSLQNFDRTYPANLSANARLSPLLTSEALRRVAWSTFYIDTIVDGGRYGFHIVDENAYRLQLPCDETRFLSNETVVGESSLNKISQPLDTASDTAEGAHLGMSAFLLRTAAARRRALHFAFRASHMEKSVDELSVELTTLEADVKDVIASLPTRFHFNSDNMFLHRDQLTTFILLHIIRHNLFIIIGRAALQIYQPDAAKEELIPPVRQNRISHALPIAGLISEGLKANIAFDPQIGVQAYVALENGMTLVLLFEPRRLAELDPSIDPQSAALMEAIPHLLTVVRSLAARSEFVKQLHIEAVHRLLRCDCAQLLTQTDLDAFLTKYQPVGQDAAEYDFRDFRWAKLERLRRGAASSKNVALDESLLQYEPGGETAVSSTAPSPRLEALDVSHALDSTLPVQSQLPVSASTAQVDETLPCWWLTEDEVASQPFPFDWPWLLSESGHPQQQTGDPTTFWNQL
ncbi:Transcription factor [Akanthomyces lecanii RCEF 1005]|uniref:Transcription factor n=1 Tax=Akanthomyces lecanii RCEF 1005 TaxID=1081108 RepID=A0A168G9V8_CORDF|nr:Transcription factor [Akanthomyces lecanii RCEF 1005]